MRVNKTKKKRTNVFFDVLSHYGKRRDWVIKSGTCQKYVFNKKNPKFLLNHYENWSKLPHHEWKGKIALISDWLGQIVDFPIFY